MLYFAWIVVTTVLIVFAGVSLERCQCNDLKLIRFLGFIGICMMFIERLNTIVEIIVQYGH